VTTYEECQYLCEVADGYDADEPEWERIPEAKREVVRERWLSRLPVSRWHLFGPQIPWYMRQRKFRIKVLGRCADVCPPTCPNQRPRQETQADE
jgi:hypothetical protein